jgi:hypothetical protein
MRFLGSVRKYLWVLILGLVVTFTLFPIQSEDLFFYLALAREYFQKGQFPASDPFMYPVVHSWTILHQWLAYLVYYGFYELGGYNAIIIAKVAAITGVLAFPLVWTRKTEKATGQTQAIFFWSVSVLIALPAMAFRLMERSSLFSDILVTVVLGILLAEIKTPSRWKYALPFLFLLWVNLHPGFPTGWALCGLAVLASLPKWRSKEFRNLCAVVAASVLACLLNPKGLYGVLYPFVFSQNEGALFRKLYYEWFPTMDPLFFWNLQSIFIIALIALNLFLLFQTRRMKPVFEMLSSLFMILYGLYAVRFVPTMSYALVLINTSLALRLKEGPWLKKANVAVAAVTIVIVVKNVFWGYDMISGHRDLGFGLDDRVVPVKAAEIVDRTVFLGNVFNAHMFGGYLAWAWNGHKKVFYHGFATDTDFYLKEYVAFYLGREQFDAQVAKYDIKVFILDRFAGEAPLIKILSEHPGWKLSYLDDSSLIFIPK